MTSFAVVPRRLPLGLAFGLALTAEMALVAVLLVRSPAVDAPQPEPVVVMRVSHVDAPQPFQPAPAPVKPEEPSPAKPPIAKPVSGKPSRPVAKAPTVVPTPVATIAPEAVAPTPVVAPDAAPVVPSTPVATPSAPSAAQQEAAGRFEDLLRAAVQDAAKFPAAARAMGRQGRVRVGFDFQDGKVSAIRVVQSGDFPAFDEAAQAAVQDASYPPAPSHLQHRTLHLVVWVEFLKKGY